ncbi:hypothetical protein Q9299_17295 [Gemmobacter fulvus]|uniref:hypothetical protein n=1 Tax=Gemmobacter fulvus TaxID=2840474 RepID=UPI0027964341|nr:hypothetical protein [Gemmobacter fulvus]MDQ1850055.1 hypothetical protein [Gemmobacter fulvus]
MQNITTLSAAEIERLVQDIAAPVTAPMVMPKQILETANRGRLRALLTRLHLMTAPRQEM